MQNTSHAVMNQRREPPDGPDDFPTPPWATRALVEHVIGGLPALRSQMCWEPACGRGHMGAALREYFAEVRCTDAFDYGFGDTVDFLATSQEPKSFDWVITNPPFRLAEQFVHQGLKVARLGVAMLARTTFIESIGRHERLFRDQPPTTFAQFSERVPMVRGRVDPTASTATGYAWLVWRVGRSGSNLLIIPPCRKALERRGDYETPVVC